MITKSAALLHYKRKEIQDAIIEHAVDREVAVKYAEGFGKRPDVLNYNGDILELAKQGATSFHMSEELWHQPLQLHTEMRKHELDALRKGWDLVIDVDFEEFTATKYIADAIIRVLQKHGISSVSCKFSGNKGFHIGVPFEAFPKNVGGKKVEALFPEGVKRILVYVMGKIDGKDNDFALSQKIMHDKDFLAYLQKEGKKIEDFSFEVCKKCLRKKKTNERKIEFVCGTCDSRVVSEEDFLKCKKCNVIMEKFVKEGSGCLYCKSKEFLRKFDLKIDTLLFSSRHMFRSVYSLHEKSGLVSVPINPDKVLLFRKEMAKPATLTKFNFKFLDRKKVKAGEAASLIIQSFDYKPLFEEDEVKEEKKFEEFKGEISEALFPPCINLILKGIEDGRKRSVFILINYLTSIGWSHEKIEELLVAWNKKNPEPLREISLLGQLRYHKTQKKNIMPPNCDNMSYYKDFGVCKPDAFCARIKNPAQYSLLKARMAEREGNKGRRKLTEEEKVERRKVMAERKKFKEEMLEKSGKK